MTAFRLHLGSNAEQFHLGRSRNAIQSSHDLIGRDSLGCRHSLSLLQRLDVALSLSSHILGSGRELIECSLRLILIGPSIRLGISDELIGGTLECFDLCLGGISHRELVKRCLETP